MGTEEAFAQYGTPKISNADQGAQFTSAELLNVLCAHDIQINTDGDGCWRDNVLVERLRRTGDRTADDAWEAPSDDRTADAIGTREPGTRTRKAYWERRPKG